MHPHSTNVATDEGRQAPAPTEANDHVDEEMLAEVLMLLKDQAPDTLTQACDLFRSGVLDRLVDIDTALAGSRFDDAARASHSLRGSAGAFGARRLTSLGGRLEQLCRESDAASAALVATDMRAEFLAFRSILDARLVELSA